MTTTDWMIYSIANCHYCDMAKNILRNHKYGFHEIAVDINPRIGAEVVEKTGQKTWPQIFYKGQLIGGWAELVEYIEHL